MKYRKGFLYQLAEDEYFQTEIYPEEHINTNFIEMTGKGFLRVKRGYAWDGPSGPTFNTKSSMRGSLIHDALYQLMRMQLLDAKYRVVADEIIYNICVKDKMWKWRAALWRRELKKFASFAANPKNIKKVYEAP